MKKIAFLMFAAGMIAFSACKEKVEDTLPDNTLYGRLGGKEMVADPANSGQMIEKGRLGLRSVIDSTIFVIAVDPKLSPYFEALLTELTAGNTTGLSALSQSLTDFFCVATGATSYTYNGLDMVKAHDPAINNRMKMKSDNAGFDQFIADVVIGAQKNQLPNDLIGEVGALIETLRGQVVQTNLYAKLGGNTMVADPTNSGQMIEQGRLGLRSVIDSTIFVIAADAQLNPYFEALLTEVGAGNTTGLTALSKSLTDFFCVASGATSYQYNGLDMVKAHDPAINNRMKMKSDNAGFDRFIADVVVGAQQNNVPNEIIGEVGALIETLRTQVVQR